MITYFLLPPDVQINAKPAVRTDQNNNVASKWFVTYLILSRTCFQMGFTACLDIVDSKFLAFKKSISAGESLEYAGKYSLTCSRVHHADWDLITK